jgi:hypothetical protein
LNANSNKWSYIGVNSKNEINQVVEKQEISNEATVGIYSWQKVRDFTKSFEDMVSANDKVNNEYYLAPTYNYMIKKGAKIDYLNIGVIDFQVHGLGTPEDLKKFADNPQSMLAAKLIRKKLNIYP